MWISSFKHSLGSFPSVFLDLPTGPEPWARPKEPESEGEGFWICFSRCTQVISTGSNVWRPVWCFSPFLGHPPSSPIFLSLFFLPPGYLLSLSHMGPLRGFLCFHRMSTSHFVFLPVRFLFDKTFTLSVVPSIHLELFEFKDHVLLDLFLLSIVPPRCLREGSVHKWLCAGR